MIETLGQTIVATLRSAAQAYAAGDQVAPCALLWPDPERLWEPILAQLQALMPELFALGNFVPAQRTGPGLWLRCIEARSIEGAPPKDVTPIFYLPGVSREQLRAVEECPANLTALVELQFRGTLWLHANGKEWTPYAYLVSKLGGLGLDVARDQATLDALAGALPKMVDEPLTQLEGRLLDAEFFNQLVAPDPSGLLLRWLSGAEVFKKRCSETEWKAFCQQCKADLRFDPDKDGPLKAAQLLAERANHWGEVWQRFAEFPSNYSGVTEWLKRAAPKNPNLTDSAEVWPHLNERDERQLQEALVALGDRSPNEAARRIAELETQHGKRRHFVWQKLGLSPLATALESLAELARFCQQSPGAPTPQAFAEFYANEGWRTDAAALAAMAAPGAQEQHDAINGVLRALYLPWLENSARHLQKLIQANGHSVAKRSAVFEAKAGRLVLFADGLRMDVAQQLTHCLNAVGLASTQEWEWSTIPSVTATAKPATSPLAGAVKGGEADDEFATSLVSSGQRLTQDRFIAALKERAWQCLGSDESGDPAGSAWTEAGTLDKRGHNEGWKVARAVESEVRDLTSRIAALLKAGWSEVIVVTDHGWLLMPGGLPKVELKSFLAENRWGRCASLKPDAQTSLPTFKWHWNPGVTIATPPGAGCFRAAMEYTHGGVSLQEMVTPCLKVTAGQFAGGTARIKEVKWTGARCRITVSIPGAPDRVLYLADAPASEEAPSGIRLDIRTSRSDPTTSLLSDRQSREVAPDGKVTVFLENDSDIGLEAEIILMDATGQIIDSLATRLGE